MFSVTTLPVIEPSVRPEVKAAFNGLSMLKFCSIKKAAAEVRPGAKGS